jgi:selenocysteine-specific elongation factor
MYVIGTAGHIDHGKSTLVHALTGIDPDRLREEKERGLTIDLGFAWLTLPSGREVSIIDVPGHERFIKNMLAGAGGIDLALLVVAADDGPMPQTLEHLAILDLLDVPSGVVALTKCDLVERDYADLVEVDLRDTLAGTRLAGAAIVRTSGATREGLDDLLRALDAALEGTPRKRDLGRPRLPIDRAFTMQGFGTVVTGTLVDGALEVGQEVELQPGRLRGRIRGLQRHRTRVHRLEPGTRAAVNLSGVHADDVRRGMVLAPPGQVRPSRVFDARLRATSILSHPVAHDSGVTFLSGTSEAEGKLRLLDRDELGRGETAWAQLALDRPVAVSRGDHCIIRTPNETVAGGVVVAGDAPRHRRKHTPTLEALQRRLEGSPAERLVDLLLAGPRWAHEAGPPLGLDETALTAAIKEAAAAGQVREAGGLLVASTWLDSAVGKVMAAAAEYLAANPLRRAAPKEHVRSAAGLDPAPFEVALGEGLARGSLQESGAGLAPAGHKVQLDAARQAEVDRYLAALAEGRYSPPTGSAPPPAVVAYLVEEGKVVDAGSGVVFAADVYREMVERVVAHLEAKGTITLAEVRDLFGTSRKYAQAFLEHLDATHVTRRMGDERVLRAPERRP